MAFTEPIQHRKANNFSSITIGLTSPEQILDNSRGEILKPETINYRSYKPEKNGLFCEKIFGPVKDWECHCGKYKRIRYRGIICDRCGVEVTRKTVRRERFGHITLAVPVVHIWYLRSIPSKISYLLGYTTKELESIVYFERYSIVNPGKSGRQYGELLTESEFLDLDEGFGIDVASDDELDEDFYFEALMGGAAIRRLLSDLDIVKTINELLKVVRAEKVSMQKRDNALKRLRILRKFDPRIEKKIINKPEWMVISVLPVIPPELRPLVPLDGGRFAASDLNDLYRRVIIRNNRLRQLMEIKAPDVILRNEKRMLQEAVDALFDNSRLRAAVRSGTRRPLKSLSDNLKGKTGRFRQNLLGKRVDYSGRSVIVVGPELKLNECGIPKEMAIELFKPMVIRHLIEQGYIRTPRSAKILIDKGDAAVYKVLEYTVRSHPVMLNRAPTLHRLGIQAFQPVLVDGRAIRLHPLCCAAFNADFDGDQMAVHVPLSAQARAEAWLLMLASHNILHPATGNPIAIPSQEMVLGCYYLTRPKKGAMGEGMRFGSYNEVRLAFENGEIDLHAIVDFRNNGEWVKETTVGRIFLNEILPDEIGYINTHVTKKKVQKIVGDSYKKAGNYATVQMLDLLKDLTFSFAFKAGASISLGDVIIPDNKDALLEVADKEVEEIQDKFDRQVLTEGERYNKVIDIWTHATNNIAKEMFKEMEEDREGFNPLFMMSDSGARGSADQIKQLAGMRGLMAKPKKSLVGSAGEIIENPIKSNFKEGLSVFEYFISTHGARKGLADTALKTADAGYLTRRLVDVAQDMTVSKDDCFTIHGLLMEDLKDGEEIIEPLIDRIYGRTTLEPIIDPIDGVHLLDAGEMIDHKMIETIERSNVYQVLVRSTLTCESEKGVCSKCYGLNLASNRSSLIGDAVGIVAAQSIGEPGTQLTLRTFHIGGTASRLIEQSEMRTKKAGVVKFSENFNTVKVVDDHGDKVEVCTVRNGKIDLDDGNGRVITTYNIPYGSKMFVKSGQKVKEKTLMVSWDPYTDVILARKSGIVRFKDMIESDTYIEETIEGGKKTIVITESKNRNLSPHIEIEDTSGETIMGGASILPVKANIIVREGQKVKEGQILVKINRGDIGKTKDITGGLPRIAELFEARKPASPAVVTEVDGKVLFGPIKRGVREIHIITNEGEKRAYKIPYGKHIIVHESDYAFAGDRLCEGSVAPQDILEIRGANRVQEYLVEQIQEVYRLQGVEINDKHIEVIVRQMMQKVEILDSGDSEFLPGDRIGRFVIKNANLEMLEKSVVENAGDSDYEVDDVVFNSNIKDINKQLTKDGKSVISVRRADPATFKPLLLGITRASLNTESFISAASFQETTRVLTDAAVEAKTDHLRGLKENVIIGRLIPAGTGTLENRAALVKEKVLEREIEEPKIETIIEEKKVEV